MTQRTMANRPCRAPDRRVVAMSLIEVVMATAILGTVVAAMVSAVLMASRSMNVTSAWATSSTHARAAADEIISDLHVALTVADLGQHNVTITVPDRTGDSAPETIKYTWSGTPGDPITRTFNGIESLQIDDVYDLSFTYLLRTIQAQNYVFSGSPGIAVDSFLLLSSNAVIDSYASRDAAYDPTAPGSEAVVSTNATADASLLVSDDAVVNGDAYVGPDGHPRNAIVYSGNGKITGRKGTLATTITMGAPSASIEVTNSGDQLFEKSTTTISNDLYCDKLEIRDGGIVNIHGDLTFVCDEEFRIDGSGQLRVLAGSKLRIIANSTVRIRDTAMVNAYVGDPSALLIYNLASATTFELRGDSQTHATIVAPSNRMTVLENAEVYGRYTGRELVMEGASKFHVDMSDPDLIAQWRFDEGSGAVADDTVGNHHGDIKGPTWTTGYNGFGLLFDGTDDHVLVPHEDALSLTNAYTFAAWIYIGEGGLHMYDLVLNKGTSGTNWNYWFGTINDEIAFGFYNGGYVEFNTTGINLQKLTWYHVAASFDNPSDTAKVYLNGELVLTDTTTAEPIANTEGLYIGTSQGGANWSGKLDDVRIYDTVLGEDRIKSLYAEGVSKHLIIWDMPIYTTPPDVEY